MRVSEVFSFGGGYKNGGLSDEAMDLLRDAFSFDYMGAAEFEFGAVPKALQKIAQHAAKQELVAEVVTVTGKRELYHPTRRTISLPPKPVYVLAPTHLREHATAVVKAQAAEEYPRSDHHLKEAALLQNSVWADEIATEEYPGNKKKERERREAEARCLARTRGWLELDNGFFFFTDHEMFEKTCALFGTAAPQPTKTDV